MVAGRVGAGDPARALDDARVDDEPDTRRAVGAERPRADVALDERRVGGEVVLGERLDLGRGDLRLEPLQVDVAVAGNADGERLDGAVGWRSLTTTFFSVSPAFQSRSSPPAEARRRSSRALRRSTSVAIVGVSGVSATARRRHVVVRDRRRHRDAHRLGVRRVVAVRAPHERVLADFQRGEELLARRAAHRA